MSSRPDLDYSVLDSLYILFLVILLVYCISYKSESMVLCNVDSYQNMHRNICYKKKVNFCIEIKTIKLNTISKYAEIFQ